MHARKRLAATLFAAAALAAAAPAGASAQTLPVPPSADSFANVCLPGIVDAGPLGPMGPYGEYGPYGPDGPLHGAKNPLGDVANCGGLFTYFARGGTIDGFVQANIQAAQP
jgi:hypothetical protein